MTGRILAIVSACIAAALAAPAAAEQTISLPTSSPPRQLHVLLASDAGGLAVDAAGNRYYSARNGDAIWMIRRRTAAPAPAGAPVEEEPIVILDRVIRPASFSQPGDIEITPDGRALVIADGAGRVIAIPFGVTLELLDQAGQRRDDCTVRVQTDEAGTSEPVGPRLGYYTVPGLMSLDPALTSQVARILVECGSAPPRAFDVALGQPEGLFGQAFVRLVVP